MKARIVGTTPPQSPETLFQEIAYIIHPVLTQTGKSAPRTLDAILEEAEGLARAINLEVTETKTLNLSKVQAGAFLGKGQRATIKAEIKALGPDIVIINHSLSPIQQRNLEKEWGAKVIDRTALILEIFGARAQTKEGRLQVELAALDYQRSRLVRSWTHLERQRGGAGFMGGPGERQIEIDRRLIDERITRLKKSLESVRRTRDLGRQSRERVPFPIVTLVGYTNAGKSTLFNRLTSANVFAEDLPFATLDPTLRRIDLPNGQTVILSDTVGFIADLPTHLVAAFRATLEQITQADVILHIIDAARPDHNAQRQDVINILGDLGIEYEEDTRIIEVWNKIDDLPEEDQSDINRKTKFETHNIGVSALTGQGMEDLLTDITTIVAQNRQAVRFSLDMNDGKALSWLYDHGEVLDRQDEEDRMTITVRLEPEDIGKYKGHFGYTPLESET